MYSVEQVLVPVDFSTFSKSALAFARQFDGGGWSDEDEPAGLQLTHAVEGLSEAMRPVLFPYAPLGEDDREFEAEIAEVVRRRLVEHFEIDDELRRRFVDEPRIGFGSDREWIQKWIGRFDADLIAMGAFGEHGVFPAGVGSTSRRAVASSTQPVALVRDYEPVPVIDRIAVGVDLGRQSPRIVEVAAGLAAEFDATVECIHTIPSPYASRETRGIRRELKVEESELKSALQPRVHEVFEELFERVEIPHRLAAAGADLSGDYRVAIGDPAAEIGRFADDTGADLVVVGTGGEDGKRKPGRVASAVMAEVPVHQVFVPPRRDATPLKRWTTR